ncbi:MAG: hypothetical protein WCI12_10800 [Actinomycetes bacterium]
MAIGINVRRGRILARRLTGSVFGGTGSRSTLLLLTVSAMMATACGSRAVPHESSPHRQAVGVTTTILRPDTAGRFTPPAQSSLPAIPHRSGTDASSPDSQTSPPPPPTTVALVTVPDLIGKTTSDANTSLLAAGLVLGSVNISLPNSNSFCMGPNSTWNIASGNIWAQAVRNSATGGTAAFGTPVDVSVCP